MDKLKLKLSKCIKDDYIELFKQKKQPGISQVRKITKEKIIETFYDFIFINSDFLLQINQNRKINQSPKIKEKNIFKLGDKIKFNNQWGIFIKNQTNNLLSHNVIVNVVLSEQIHKQIDPTCCQTTNIIHFNKIIKTNVVVPRKNVYLIKCEETPFVFISETYKD